MTYRTPDFWTAVIAATAPALGALARWQEQHLFDRPFSVGQILLDLAVSVMIGVLGFWIAMDMNQPESIAAAVAAIGGNVGSRVFSIASRLLERKAARELGDSEEDDA